MKYALAVTYNNEYGNDNVSPPFSVVSCVLRRVSRPMSTNALHT